MYSFSFGDNWYKEEKHVDIGYSIGSRKMYLPLLRTVLYHDTGSSQRFFESQWKGTKKTDETYLTTRTLAKCSHKSLAIIGFPVFSLQGDNSVRG